MPSPFAILLLLTSALLVHAGVNQSDFIGLGHIAVLKSDEWQSATPKMKIGCLNNHGRFIGMQSTQKCGMFSRLNDYPWTLSTKHGNCTFNDESMERNTDSVYGRSDFAWNCNKTHQAEIYDELYTVDGFPYVFLCYGDVACYYDAKKAPEHNEVLPLWQFHWGSEQMGITPGHIQLQLLWEKAKGSPKREGTTKIPGPSTELHKSVQVPLQGAKAKN